VRDEAADADVSQCRMHPVGFTLEDVGWRGVPGQVSVVGQRCDDSRRDRLGDRSDVEPIGSGHWFVVAEDPYAGRPALADDRDRSLHRRAPAGRTRD
jgi:hypothetical protein